MYMYILAFCFEYFPMFIPSSSNLGDRYTIKKWPRLSRPLKFRKIKSTYHNQKG